MSGIFDQGDLCDDRSNADERRYPKTNILTLNAINNVMTDLSECNRLHKENTMPRGRMQSFVDQKVSRFILFDFFTWRSMSLFLTNTMSS